MSVKLDTVELGSVQANQVFWIIEAVCIKTFNFQLMTQEYQSSSLYCAEVMRRMEWGLEH